MQSGQTEYDYALKTYSPCEECLRTLFELIAEGRDPKRYGFDYTEKDLRHSRQTVLRAYSRTIAPAWSEIKMLMQKMPVNAVPQSARWVPNCDFERECRKVKRLYALTSLPRRVAVKLWGMTTGK